MRPKIKIRQAAYPFRHTQTATLPVRLDAVAAQLMAVQRCWTDPGRADRLSAALESSRSTWQAIQAALARGELALPCEVQHNVLILSVYADHRIAACEANPSAAALGSLIALTRTLAVSLRDWREAA